MNRHNYSMSEIDEALQRPVVRALMELTRLRNRHPAFDGKLEVKRAGASRIQLTWTSGESRCTLDVDVSTGRYDVDT